MSLQTIKTTNVLIWGMICKHNSNKHSGSNCLTQIIYKSYLYFLPKQTYKFIQNVFLFIINYFILYKIYFVSYKYYNSIF